MFPLPYITRCATLLALTLVMSSCVSWQTHDGDVVDALRRERPERARILLDSGRALELEHPTVVDSLVVGRTDGVGTVVPATSIVSVETGGTRYWMAALIAGAVVAAPILADIMARALADAFWPVGGTVGR